MCLSSCVLLMTRITVVWEAHIGWQLYLSVCDTFLFDLFKLCFTTDMTLVSNWYNVSVWFSLPMDPMDLLLPVNHFMIICDISVHHCYWCHCFWHSASMLKTNVQKVTCDNCKCIPFIKGFYSTNFFVKRKCFQWNICSSYLMQTNT